MQTDTRKTLTCLIEALKQGNPETLNFDALLLDLQGSLSRDEGRQGQVLLGNLKNFQEHLDAALLALQLECPLFKAFKADLLKSARCTLLAMLENCLKAADAANSAGLKSLLAAKEADVRTLVPSRMLARELGVPDQVLRREIYLARQKAAMPKSAEPVEPEECANEEDESFVISTCASPLRREDCVGTDDEWLDVEAWLNSEIFA